MADEPLHETKTCTKCGEIKPATHEFFSRTTKARCGLRPHCKPCVNAQEKRRRLANPHEGRTRSAAWYAANKERRNQASDAYYAANKKRVAANRLARIAADPDGMKKRCRDWSRARYRRDPAVRINDSISSAVYKCLRGEKGGRSWQTLVGYSVADLVTHLERQFAKNMTWDNFGDWHIDHIIPKALFSFQTSDDPEFKACWALSNLRPLWAEDNLKKWKKRLNLI